MYSKVLVLIAVVALASANDLYLAATNNTDGHKQIYDEHLEAQWAITKQTKEVFVNATVGVICLVNVTDLRPNKDGEARITSGGIGQDNVTITLSSPAAFRGFDFRVEVYSDMHEHGHDSDEPDHPEEPETPENHTATGLPTGVPSSTATAEVAGHTGKPTEIPTSKPEVSGLPTIKPEVRGLPTSKPEVSGLPTSKPEVSGLPTSKPEVSDLPTGKPVTVNTDKFPKIPELAMGMDRVPMEAKNLEI